MRNLLHCALLHGEKINDVYYKLFLFVDSDSFGQEINRDEYCRNVKVDFAKKVAPYITENDFRYDLREQIKKWRITLKRGIRWEDRRKKLNVI